MEKKKLVVRQKKLEPKCEQIEILKLWIILKIFFENTEKKREKIGILWRKSLHNNGKVIDLNERNFESDSVAPDI